MTLRHKTFYLIAVTLVTLVLILYQVSRLTLLENYRQLEASVVVADTERVIKSIDGHLGQLVRTSIDWAYWDDTARFAWGENEDYIADNLDVDTLVNLGLNFVIYQDQNGHVIYSGFVDLEAEEETAPTFAINADFLDLLKPEPDNVHSGANGIIKVNNQPLLVVSRHILPSHAGEPSAGTLIFGIYLDETWITTLSDRINTDFAFYALDEPSLPESWQEAIGQISNSDQIVVRPANERDISGYRVVRDVSGVPVFLLKTDLPRIVYQQGLNALRYFVGNLIIFGAAVILVILFLMDRLVLARLEQLHQGVTRIRQTGDLSLAVHSQGADEVASLGRVLNDLMREVEQSRQQLQSFNMELERRVEERTEALAWANKALHEEISEHQQTETKLAAARDQAMEALRLKAQILANVSHDVRTPLNVIILRCEMLLHESNRFVDDHQQKMLETIRFSGQELLRLFNNLLEQSQNQDRKLKIAEAPFTPSELIQEVETVLQPLAERRGLVWRSEVDANLPTVLIGDKERLKQILNNLVDNAIKFTEIGEIVVRLEKSGEELWSLVVRDTGCGIAEKDKSQVFDTFWQADGSLTRSVNRGIGLGLSIVKELTLLMSGEVRILSEGNGTGSIFMVTLPLKNMENEKWEGVAA